MPNIYWKDALKQKLKIIDKGGSFSAGGKSVYWFGDEGSKPQLTLRRLAKPKKKRKTNILGELERMI